MGVVEGGMAFTKELLAMFSVDMRAWRIHRSNQELSDSRRMEIRINGMSISEHYFEGRRRREVFGPTQKWKVSGTGILLRLIRHTRGPIHHSSGCPKSCRQCETEALEQSLHWTINVDSHWLRSLFFPDDLSHML